MPDQKFEKEPEILKQTPEIRAGFEHGREQKENAAERAIESNEGAGAREKNSGRIAAAGSLSVAGRESEELTVEEVENILEKGTEEFYLKMPPDKAAEFKREGEKTALAIKEILNKAKIKAGKIIDLIKKWLALIPGVNRFFLDQEAKIKADEILKASRGED